MADDGDDIVRRYLTLGLALGRHVDGLVDAYYGPPELAEQAAAEPPRPAAALAAEAARLLADLDGADLDAARRHWLRAQVRGLHTTARKLAGEAITYADEVEWCYGVRPRRMDEEVFAEAHRRLDEVLPGHGPVRDRYVAWRESHVVPVDTLRAAIESFAEDFRERTHRMFGLPEGEAIEFDLVSDKPWGGFNYYQGGLRSRVVINTDLPVLSPQLPSTVAHEAYPGHHTEHCRKEVGLVRRRRHDEETIFLVGTPQCLVSEGLADLGLEVVAGRRPEPVVAEHYRSFGVRYDADVVAQVSEAADGLNWVRGNAGVLLHEERADADDVVAYIERWSLVPEARARKTVEFLTDPTWRAYMSCYVEGLPLCRSFVGGDPARFERLVTEQLTTADLLDSGTGITRHSA